MSLSLSAYAPLVPADGWWLVRRLPDVAHPHVWERRPIAAWTLVPGEGGDVEMVALLGNGLLVPRRVAVDGRDGADFHCRSDAFHRCDCDVSPASTVDACFCSYCAGLRPFYG